MDAACVGGGAIRTHLAARAITMHFRTQSGSDGWRSVRRNMVIAHGEKNAGFAGCVGGGLQNRHGCIGPESCGDTPHNRGAREGT